VNELKNEADVMSGILSKREEEAVELRALLDKSVKDHEKTATVLAHWQEQHNDVASLLERSLDELEGERRLHEATKRKVEYSEKARGEEGGEIKILVERCASLEAELREVLDDIAEEENKNLALEKQLSNQEANSKKQRQELGVKQMSNVVKQWEAKKSEGGLKDSVVALTINSKSESTADQIQRLTELVAALESENGLLKVVPGELEQEVHRLTIALNEAKRTTATNVMPGNVLQEAPKRGRIYEGMLMKIGMVTESERYVVLTDEACLLFKRPQDTVAKTYIPYHRFKGVTKSGDKRFTIITVGGGKTEELFECNNNEERNKWLLLLNRLVEDWKKANPESIGRDGKIFTPKVTSPVKGVQLESEDAGDAVAAYFEYLENSFEKLQDDIEKQDDAMIVKALVGPATRLPLSATLKHSLNNKVARRQTTLMARKLTSGEEGAEKIEIHAKWSVPKGATEVTAFFSVPEGMLDEYLDLPEPPPRIPVTKASSVLKSIKTTAPPRSKSQIRERSLSPKRRGEAAQRQVAISDSPPTQPSAKPSTSTKPPSSEKLQVKSKSSPEPLASSKNESPARSKSRTRKEAHAGKEASSPSITTTGSASMARYGLSREEIRDLSRAFSLFDLDSSGYIDYSELGEVLQSLGIYVEDAQYRIMRRMDRDGDAKIDLDEFLEASAPYLRSMRTKSIASPAYASVEKASRISVRSESIDMNAGRKLFETADNQGRGSLNPVHMARYLHSNRAVIERLAGSNFRSDAFYNAIPALPVTDGVVTKEAFVAFYSQFSIKPKGSSPSIDSKEDPMESGLRELFDLFDVDGTGYVGASEMADVMQALGLPSGPNDVAAIMSHVDTSGDGRMSFREFKEAMQRSQRELGRSTSSSQSRSPPTRKGSPKLSDTHMYELSEAFDTFDIDGNGCITVDEMHLAMRDMGIAVTSRQVRQIVSELDLDGDSAISFDEFVNAVAPHLSPADQKLGKVMV